MAGKVCPMLLAACRAKNGHNPNDIEFEEVVCIGANCSWYDSPRTCAVAKILDKLDSIYNRSY